jgi:hypothetical protein
VKPTEPEIGSSRARRRVMRLPSPSAGAVLGLVCALLAEGCSRKPIQFSRGDRIPLDTYTVTVSYVEAVQTRPSALDLIVHFRCQGITSREVTGKFFVMFGGHMSVIDSDGNQYAALPFTLDYYGSHGLSRLGDGRDFSGSSDLSEWVAVAKVPTNSHGFSFLVGNPNARPGQPRAAIIPLGR